MADQRLYVDTETYSTVNLRDRGLAAYLHCPDFRVLLIAWAFDDGEVTVSCLPDDPPPAYFFTRLADDDVIKVAHYATFDRLALTTGARVSPPESWHCTAVMARECNLPWSLNAVGAALGLDATERKAQEDKGLIGLFCRPQANGMPMDRALSKPEWERFCAYAKQDVVALRAIYQRLRTWGWDRTLYAADCAINARGVRLDEHAAEQMVADAEEIRQSLTASVRALSDNRVQSPTALAQIKKEIAVQGVAVPADLTVTTCQRLADDPETPDKLAGVLRCRVQAAPLATVAKAQTMLDHLGPDSYLRHMTVLAGASRTGRWSGVGPQLQNLPRPVADAKGAAALAGRLRSLLCAPAGQKLVRADWSNVEGRVLAWLAGATAKLAAFRESDAGSGPDLYRLLYAQMTGVAVGKVTKEQRQMAKVCELAMGYGGGVVALASAITDAGLSVDAIADQFSSAASVDEKAAAEKAWELAFLRRRADDLPAAAYEGLHVLVQRYRAQNKSIVDFWRECDSAAKQAVRERKEVQVRRCRFQAQSSTLTTGIELLIELPSSRLLHYHDATLRSRDEADLLTGETRLVQDLLVQQPVSGGGWQQQTIRGTQLAQHTTQAVACDLLRDVLKRLYRDHWRVVHHVHDEVVCEEAVADVDRDLLLAIMTDTPWWADGLPIHAEGSIHDTYG